MGTIRELAQTIARVTGFTGQLVWDNTKSDGTRLPGVQAMSLHTT
jgi:hypothetical protein